MYIDYILTDMLYIVAISVSDPDRMDPHIFDHLDPDPDPQKICGSGSRVTKLTKIGKSRLKKLTKKIDKNILTMYKDK